MDSMFVYSNYIANGEYVLDFVALYEHISIFYRVLELMAGVTKMKPHL